MRALARLALAGLLLAATAAPAAASQCVYAAYRDGVTLLLNRCTECRMAELERQRPGDIRPIRRSVVVGARRTVPSPFPGKGRTRLVDERPCRAAAAETQATTATAPDGRACVKLHRLHDGRIAAVNGCRACRSVLVARKPAKGGANHQGSYSIAPGGTLPLDGRGFASARIMSDSPCR
ncbi:MAG: hypothetical protein H6907_21380 [Hyphomicrobiales bacterium]|nr:hypothetical protein [Hyphomicrobiales bacterium]MCP5374296.1 hypothetical protein [Hyphomicrobiales bacterium]